MECAVALTGLSLNKEHERAGLSVPPCIQSRRRWDAADPEGDWFATRTNRRPSAPGELHLHSSAPTENRPAEFCCTLQTASRTDARPDEDKHENGVSFLFSFPSSSLTWTTHERDMKTDPAQAFLKTLRSELLRLRQSLYARWWMM